MKYLWLILIFCYALWIRTENLGGHCFWIDETLYIGMVQNISTQELVPSLIGKLTNTNDEYSTRLPFAIAGSLTVFAIYFVLKNKKIALLIGLFYAVCPLFVWWARLARPYAFAGLFMVIAWRYPLAMIPSILCTPISMLGLNLTKIRKYGKWFIGILIFTILVYFMREDYDRGHWEIQNILDSTRWAYLPSLAVLLYIGDWYSFLYELPVTAK